VTDRDLCSHAQHKNKLASPAQTSHARRGAGRQEIREKIVRLSNVRPARFLALLAMAALWLLALPAAAQSVCPTLPTASLPWGIQIMNFPAAWEKTCGTANVGVIDRGVFSPDNGVPHPLLNRVRPQFIRECLGGDKCLLDSFHGDEQPNIVYAPNEIRLKGHGTHVMGIIGASYDSTTGIVGGCRGCSLYLARGDIGNSIKSGIKHAAQSGAQVVNISGSSDEITIASEGLALAAERDISVVAASGNSDKAGWGRAIRFPASDPRAIAVGGVEPAPETGGWKFWEGISNPVEYPIVPNVPGAPYYGSSFEGFRNGDPLGDPIQWVVAPAVEVQSTFYFGQRWVLFGGAQKSWSCADDSVPMIDDSNPVFPPVQSPGSGFGKCTGTSMSAPHVTALVALMRSANPLLSAAQTKLYLGQSGSIGNAPTQQLGRGLPNAASAVQLALGGGSFINRKTPLFALRRDYQIAGEVARRDHVYTVFPQVAVAAFTDGLTPLMSPNYYQSIGTSVPGYAAYPVAPTHPTDPAWVPQQPKGIASVLSTHVNPVPGGPSLIPLYRMSWTCPNCGTGSNESVSHTYVVVDTLTSGAVLEANNYGYQVDGIEGFVFPRVQDPATLPADAVKLCRMYSPSLDDYMLYAGVGRGSDACLLASPGGDYQSVGAYDWLGYVYPLSAPEAILSLPPPSTVGSLQIIAGSGQAAAVTQPFASALRARLLSTSGTAMAGQTITLQLPTSGASATLSATSATTDANGEIAINATANTIAGTFGVVASVSGKSATWNLTNVPGTPASLTTNGVVTQSASLGAQFAQPLSVLVRDAYGNNVSGIAVIFTPPASGASATISTAPATNNGVTSVTATANNVEGTYAVVASIAGIASTTSFTLTNALPSFVNGSFESPVAPTDNVVSFPNVGWTQYGYEAAYVSSGWLSMTGQPPAPDGVQAAYFRHDSGMWQNVYFAPGYYAITFSAKSYPGYPNTVTRVRFNGGDIAAVTPLTGSWSTYQTQTFQVTAAGTYQIDVSSGTPATWGYHEIDNFRIVRGNRPPQVSITSPANGQVFTQGQPITITATASDPDGTIQNVKLFSGSTELATITSPPYTTTWSTTAVNGYTLSARATDNAGASSTASVSVSVVCGAGNVLPTVALSSPASGATYIAPASVSLSASASDVDGYITKVEYWTGATKIGESSASPWNATWSGVVVGTYAVTAKAFDSCGASVTSAARTITVSAPPTPVFLNPSFELQAVPAGATASMTTNGWTPYGPGVEIWTNGALNAASMPSTTAGTQVLGIYQVTTSGVMQYVTLPGGTYSITLNGMMSEGNPMRIEVLSDGVSIGWFTSFGWWWWTTHTTSTFTVPAGGASVRVDIRTSIPNPNILFIDNVRINVH